jgi:biopolymer transport protein TolQ
LIVSCAGGLFLQLEIWDLVQSTGPLPKAVLGILIGFSLVSWAVILSKWATFRRSRSSNRAFLRAFRKAPALDTIAAASEQFNRCPLVAVFDFGYSEVARQMKSRGSVTNPLALERTLQLGISEEVTRLERRMSVLATTAGVSPFIGLFGTVWGIIDAFQQLSTAGAASLRAVAPGISEALITTAMGLFAAIPAYIFYNIFSSSIKEFAARMEDFALEFLNLTERSLER